MAALAGILVGLAAVGCGGSSTTATSSSATRETPGYLTGPPTPTEQLVAKGAALAVAYGCSACHLSAATPRSGPTFYGFAGRYVTLTSGRKVLVDRRFLTAALDDPGRYRIRGYPLDVMWTVLGHLHVHLEDHPRQVAALAAFIEQVGPEA